MCLDHCFGSLTSPWAVERIVSRMTTTSATHFQYRCPHILLSCCTAIADVPMVAVLQDNVAELKERSLGGGAIAPRVNWRFLSYDSVESRNTR